MMIKIELINKLNSYRNSISAIQSLEFDSQRCAACQIYFDNDGMMCMNGCKYVEFKCLHETYLCLNSNSNSLGDLAVKNYPSYAPCGANVNGNEEIDRLHQNGCCSCFGY